MLKVSCLKTINHAPERSRYSYDIISSDDFGRYFSETQEKFEFDKPESLKLLESTIDLCEIFLVSFRNHFYASTERTREYHLTSLLWALILQKIFSVPTDSLLLTFIEYSKDLREFCGKSSRCFENHPVQAGIHR